MPKSLWNRWLPKLLYHKTQGNSSQHYMLYVWTPLVQRKLFYSVMEIIVNWIIQIKCQSPVLAGVWQSLSWVYMDHYSLRSERNWEQCMCKKGQPLITKIEDTQSHQGTTASSSRQLLTFTAFGLFRSGSLQPIILSAAYSVAWILMPRHPSLLALSCYSASCLDVPFPGTQGVIRLDVTIYIILIILTRYCWDRKSVV